MPGFFRWIVGLFVSLTVLLAVLWAAGALFFDLPWPEVRTPAALAFLGLIAFLTWRMRGFWKKSSGGLVGVVLVLGWWETLQPRDQRSWQADVARTAFAEIDGDVVTLHNIRNCDYRTETDYTPHWETRTVHLSQLTGVDLAINYWGSPWMAHPIASFQFANAPPVCFSIETRKEIGESYSALGGLYRQYELIYVVADERDVIRVRTNYRKGEDIYLYRSTLKPAQAQVRFLDYLKALNELNSRPRWYNAITTNCTTSIRTQHRAEDRTPWDWRILLNGKGDEMLYENHSIITAGLPFSELKKISLINSKAKAADQDPQFSRRIREGLPPFTTSSVIPD